MPTYSVKIPYPGDEAMNASYTSQLRWLAFRLVGQFPDPVMFGGQEFDGTIGQNTIIIKATFASALSAAQQLLLKNLVEHPELWRRELPAATLSIKVDPEIITAALNQLVPNKGLLYYGAHNTLNIHALQTPTSQDLQNIIRAMLDIMIVDLQNGTRFSVGDYFRQNNITLAWTR